MMTSFAQYPRCLVAVLAVVLASAFNLSGSPKRRAVRHPSRQPIHLSIELDDGIILETHLSAGQVVTIFGTKDADGSVINMVAAARARSADVTVERDLTYFHNGLPVLTVGSSGHSLYFEWDGLVPTITPVNAEGDVLFPSEPLDFRPTSTVIGPLAADRYDVVVQVFERYCDGSTRAVPTSEFEAWGNYLPSTPTCSSRMLGQHHKEAYATTLYLPGDFVGERDLTAAVLNLCDSYKAATTAPCGVQGNGARKELAAACPTLFAIPVVGADLVAACEAAVLVWQLACNVRTSCEVGLKADLLQGVNRQCTAGTPLLKMNIDINGSGVAAPSRFSQTFAWAGVLSTSTPFFVQRRRTSLAGIWRDPLDRDNEDRDQYLEIRDNGCAISVANVSKNLETGQVTRIMTSAPDSELADGVLSITTVDGVHVDIRVRDLNTLVQTISFGGRSDTVVLRRSR